MDHILEDNRRILPINSLDIFFPLVLSVSVIVFSLIVKPGIRHWSLIPLFFCGFLTGIDAFRWIRGAYDTFDPNGLIGAFGVNFFFIAPLLCLMFEPDVAMQNISNPTNWELWIGYMAILNIVGLLIYKSTQYFAFRFVSPSRKVWQISSGNALPIMFLAAILASFCWVMVMIKMGGFAGIIQSTIYREDTAWQGVGKYRIPMRSFVILCVIIMTLLRKSSLKSNWFILCVIYIGCFAGQILTGGLSGSRNVTVFLMIWISGIIHYYWRSLKAKHIIIGIIPLLVFAYVYGLYKKEGSYFVGVFRRETTFREIAIQNNKDFAGLLVGDLSRADIQAWMLYKYNDPSFNFNFRKGRTYLAASVWLIPKFLIPWQKLPDSYKTRTGTAFMFWEGFYSPWDKNKKSLRMYGLAGEAIMNFGILGVPVMFGVWGLIMGYYRKKWITWNCNDSRFLIAPHLSILLLLALISDSDNVFGYFFGAGLISIFLVWLISKKNLLADVNQDTINYISEIDNYE